MATLIRADGRTEEVRPASARGKWTLEELQAHVGGLIQFMPGMNKRGLPPLRLVLDEEAGFKGKPVNLTATMLVRERLLEIGKPLRYMPTLLGDVVRLEKGDKV